MTAEVLDYRIKQIKHITGVDILDDKSLDEALFKLIGMYSNLKKENMEIRAKAIDEFAERIKQGDVIEYMGSYVSYEAIASFIDEIAEQMKGGATDEC